MTDEEMAEQYAQNLEKELMKEYEEHLEYGQTPYLATIPTPHAKQAFLAGLKAGRPQWHKMDYHDKKNFKNIPRHTELLTKYSCGLFEAHCINRWTGNHWCEHSHGIVAWCELPKFDKE